MLSEWPANATSTTETVRVAMNEYFVSLGVTRDGSFDEGVFEALRLRERRRIHVLHLSSGCEEGAEERASREEYVLPSLGQVLSTQQVVGARTAPSEVAVAVSKRSATRDGRSMLTVASVARLNRSNVRRRLRTRLLTNQCVITHRHGRRHGTRVDRAGMALGGRTDRAREVHLSFQSRCRPTRRARRPDRRVFPRPCGCPSRCRDAGRGNSEYGRTHPY